MAAPADSKPLRSDARRNRERIVATARTLFTTAGVDVSVEEITRQAGVGMGTLYRHFATKEDLIDAVLEEAYDEFLVAATLAVEEPDAWTGLCAFFERALAMHADNRGLKDFAAGDEHARVHVVEVRRRLQPLLARLVERAKEQGSLRDDFTPGDITLLLWAGGHVIERSSTVAPDLWRRYLALVLDGLGPGARSPLPHPPLTPAELDDAYPVHAAGHHGTRRAS